MASNERRFNINADYYGAINQLPMFVKALKEEFPSTEIVYTIGDFHGSEKNSLEEKAIKLLQAYGLEYKPKEEWGKYITISFDISGREICSCKYDRDDNIYVPIDPLKFEERILLNEQEKEALRKKYKIKAKNVFCAGSVKEINDTSTIVKMLSKKCEDDFQFIIVPRTKNGTIRFLNELGGNNPKFKIRLSSEWEDFDNQDYNILVVDEMGILADLYSISTVAHITGTHWEYGNGGQNPLEPAFYGVRMISGPKWHNNSNAFEGLRESGLLKVVNSDEEFIDAVENPPSKEELENYRKNASAFIKSKQGYAQHCVRKIKEEFGL